MNIPKSLQNVALKSRVAALLAASTGGCLSDRAVLADCTRYEIKTLGVQCVGGYVRTAKVNDQGVLTGYFACALVGKDTPFCWDGATAETIILPAGFEGRPRGINAGGQVVGWTRPVSSGISQPFIASFGQPAELLPLLPLDVGGEANSINSSGTIAGWTDSNSSWIKSVRWVDGVPEELLVPIGPSSQANDLNDLGQICGYMGVSPDSDAVAYLWDNSVVTDLGKYPGDLAATATALNNTGDSVGYGRFLAKDGKKYRHGLVWTDGEISVVDPYPEYLNCYLFDVNDASVAVGSCDKRFDLVDSIGVIYQDGVLHNLNDFLEPGIDVVVNIARGINNAGQIAADGTIISKNEAVAVLLTPIPPIVGDLTCDWIVDGQDLGLLLSAWGECAVAPQQDRGGRDGRPTDGDRPTEPPPCPADLNGDTIVDGADLGLLLSNWTS